MTENKTTKSRDAERKHILKTLITTLMFLLVFQRMIQQSNCSKLSGKYKKVYEWQENSLTYSNEYLWKEWKSDSNFGQILILLNNQEIEFIFKNKNSPGEWLKEIFSIPIQRNLVEIHHSKVDFIAQETNKLRYFKFIDDPLSTGGVKLPQVGYFELEGVGSHSFNRVIQLDHHHLAYYQKKTELFYLYDIDDPKIDIDLPLHPNKSLKERLVAFTILPGAIGRSIGRVFRLKEKMLFLLYNVHVFDFCIYSTDINSILNKANTQLIEENCITSLFSGLTTLDLDQVIQRKDFPNILILPNPNSAYIFRFNGEDMTRVTF